MRPAVPEQLCIIGAGGAGGDALLVYHAMLAAAGWSAEGKVIFAEEDACWQERAVLGIPVRPLSQCLHVAGDTPFIVAIGDPSVRSRIVAGLEGRVQWATLVHPEVALNKWLSIGTGSLINAGCILSANVALGRHTQLNIGTTVAHDFRGGDFLTTAPGVRISGHCAVGAGVHMGTGVLLRDRISITDGVMVGMGSVVTRSITEAGVYYGAPAKRAGR